MNNTVFVSGFDSNNFGLAFGHLDQILMTVKNQKQLLFDNHNTHINIITNETIQQKFDENTTYQFFVYYDYIGFHNRYVQPEILRYSKGTIDQQIQQLFFDKKIEGYQINRSGRSEVQNVWKNNIIVDLTIFVDDQTQIRIKRCGFNQYVKEAVDNELTKDMQSFINKQPNETNVVQYLTTGDCSSQNGRNAFYRYIQNQLTENRILFVSTNSDLKSSSNLQKFYEVSQNDQQFTGFFEISYYGWAVKTFDYENQHISAYIQLCLDYYSAYNNGTISNKFDDKIRNYISNLCVNRDITPMKHKIETDTINHANPRKGQETLYTQIRYKQNHFQNNKILMDFISFLIEKKLIDQDKLSDPTFL